jgi:hypothetical protein
MRSVVVLWRMVNPSAPVLRAPSVDRAPMDHQPLKFEMGVGFSEQLNIEGEGFSVAQKKSSKWLAERGVQRSECSWSVLGTVS